MDGENYLTLTESGAAIANKVYERHRVISGYLKSLGVSEETASNDACRIEHVISDESFAIIKGIYEASLK